jgi:hypothetical protein
MADGTENIRLTAEDLKDPNLYRVNRRLELIEENARRLAAKQTAVSQTVSPSTTSKGSGAIPPTGQFASNVVAASVTVLYGLFGNASAYGFEINSITLPTSDPNYHQPKFIHVQVTLPDGSTDEICSLPAGVTSYQGPIQYLQDGQSHNLTVQFLCENEDGAVTPNPFTMQVTVTPATVTALSAVDNVAQRWKDSSQALHAQIDITVSLSVYPQVVTIWTDDGGGALWHGWFRIDGASQVVSLGAKDSNTIVYPPLDGDHSWTVKVAIGPIESNVSPPASAASATFTMHAPPAPAATAASNMWIETASGGSNADYYSVGGSHKFGFKGIHVTIPGLDDPNFWFARMKVQSGKIVGGVFVPGGIYAYPNGDDGIRPGVGAGDWATDTDHDSWIERIPSTNNLIWHDNGGWEIPTDGNVVFRWTLWITTRRGGPAGTTTQQNGWSNGINNSTPGSNSYQDLTVDPSQASSSVPAASNVVSASVSIAYGLFGNAAAYGFTISGITLPTSDPNYHQPKFIHVQVTLPDGSTDEICSLPAGVTSYQGPIQYLQDGQSHNLTVQFLCENEDGVVTPNPFTVTVALLASAVTGISNPREVPGMVTVDPTTRLEYTVVGGTPVIANNQIPQNVTYYFSADNGASFTWIGWKMITQVGQEIQFSIVKRAATCQLAMVAGALGGDPTKAISAAQLPPQAVISSSFSVGGLGLPQANLISSLTIPSGTGPANNPYNTATADGMQYWSIPSVSYDDTNAVNDPNCFFIRVTAETLNASKVSIVPEAAFAGAAVGSVGHTYTSGRLDGQYAGGAAYVRFRVYACNRSNQGPDAFKDSACATLQTGIGGGLGYVDVLIANGGNPPAGAILATRIDSTTLGSGLKKDSSSKLAIAYGAALADDGSGQATVKISGPLFKDVQGNLNLQMSTDFVVVGGQLTQNAVNLAKAYNFSSEFTTAGGFMSVNGIAINKLLAGSALFLGPAVFAASNGGQVTISSAGITLADSISSPVSTVAVASSGVTISRGSNSLQLTASGISILGPSGSLTATTGGIAITNGSNSVTVAPSGVSIVGGSLSSPTITGGSLQISNSYATTVLSSATQGLEITLTGAGRGFSVAYGSSLVYVAVGSASAQLTVTNYPYTTAISPSTIAMGDSSGTAVIFGPQGDGGTVLQTFPGRSIWIGGGICVSGTYGGTGYGIFGPNASVYINLLTVVNGISCYSVTATTSITCNSVNASGSVSCNSLSVGGVSGAAGAQFVGIKDSTGNFCHLIVNGVDFGQQRFLMQNGLYTGIG